MEGGPGEVRRLSGSSSGVGFLPPWGGGGGGGAADLDADACGGRWGARRGGGARARGQSDTSPILGGGRGGALGL